MSIAETLEIDVQFTLSHIFYLYSKNAYKTYDGQFFLKCLQEIKGFNEDIFSLKNSLRLFTV